MAREKLGKVVENIKGFRIRMEMEERSSYGEPNRFGKKKLLGTKSCFTGKYGVYAGKNLRKGGLTLDSAREFANK